MARRFEWCGREIELLLNDDGGTFEESAAHALELIDKEQLWQAEFDDRLYAELYSNWDENWRQDNPPLNKVQWLARLDMQSLEVSAEGYFTVMFGDGDLFWGHWLEVFGKVDEGAKYASLLG